MTYIMRIHTDVPQTLCHTLLRVCSYNLCKLHCALSVRLCVVLLYTLFVHYLASFQELETQI